MWWLIPAAGATWFFSQQPPPPPPPRSTNALLTAGLWACGASTTAFLSLAALQGLHNRFTNGAYSRTLSAKQEEYRLSKSTPHLLLNNARLSLSVVGLNLAVFVYGQQNPRQVMRLVDSHHDDWTQNWTLLTSAFCHIDRKHLTANMWSLVPELPHLLQVCGQSPYQFAAFYISAAIFSSYAQRVVSYSRWTQSWVSVLSFTKPRGLGASGVAMAVFAVSCFSQSWTSVSFLVSFVTLGRQVANDVQGLLYSNQMIGFAVS